ncbi:MAG: hypothetical protein KF773_13755 [Deltaproteobacteria bacterium]|nr:hypothetical protein [Deltaproteobacteria bacterium]MCW5803063.1 hypothetical protein [Deltaproteobacteria bacterium]
MRMLPLALLALLAAPALAEKAPIAPKKKSPLKQPPIAPATAARLPDPGRLASYKSNTGLVVVRIGKAGVTELFRKELDGTDMWLDGKTIAVVDTMEGDVTVDYIVDGALDPKRRISVKKAAWGLKASEQPVMYTPYRVDKEVWVEGCLVQEGGEELCRKSAWLRADATPPKVQRTKPAKAVRVYDIVTSVAPDIKTPAGFAAKITKVKGDNGLECTGPKGKVAWQVTNEGGAGSFVPKKLHWVHANPPIFGAEGIETNPVGWESTVTKYYRACAEAQLDEFTWIHDGVWASSNREDDDLITVRVDDTPVAVFEGRGFDVAPK